VLFMVVAIAWGCDTTSNTPDPSKHFFIRYYGSDGDQKSVDMVANADGTFMLLGNSVINGESQIYLLKVNADGIIVWEKTYGGPNNEIAKDIEQTADGNYIILADYQSPAVGTDILLMSVDQNGNQQDSTTFSYSGVSDEIGVSVTQLLNATSPAGFIVAGNTNYDSIPGDNGADGFEKSTAIFIRFNADFSLAGDEWNNHSGALEDDYCTKVFQVGDLTDPDSDPFVFFGYTNSNPNIPSFNFWATGLTRGGDGASLDIDAKGVIPGSPVGTDEILGSVTSIVSTAGFNNYLLCGISSSLSGGNDEIFLAKLNTSNLTVDGVLAPKVININLGDISSGATNLQKVTAYPSKNLGYLIAANSIASGNSDIILTKVGVDGNPVWTSPIVLGGPNNDFESAIYELPDRRIIVFGTMELGDEGQAKLAFMKLNSNGEFND